MQIALFSTKVKPSEITLIESVYLNRLKNIRLILKTIDI